MSRRNIRPRLRTVVYRSFDVQVGMCDHCGQAVQGRHAL
jgi:hypothetical protein